METPRGCERGELFEGSKRRGERGLPRPGPMGRLWRSPHPRGGSRVEGAGFSETRRTPGPVAGCNKPAVLCAEKAVEVVRNHEGGTRCWTGGAVGPWLFGAAGFGRREASGPGVDARRMCRWRGEQGHEPQERQGLGARSELRLRSVHTARGPATVRTLRRSRTPQQCGGRDGAVGSDAGRDAGKVRECRRGAVRRIEATPR